MPRSSGRPANQLRTNDLALIHIAKAQLDMPDEQYRDILWSVGRVRSAKDLDWAGRQRVLDHFRACGWKPVAKAGKVARLSGEWTFVFRMPPEHQIHLRKIYRLCQAIGARQTPPVAVMPKAWAEGALTQMRGHAGADVGNRLEMADADELHRLVQALEIHRKRLGAA